MKNLVKLIGIISVAVVIIFSIVACDDFNNLNNSEPEEQTGLVKVLIPLPNSNVNSIARSVSTPEAITHTDLFELIMTNIDTNVVYTASASLEDEFIEIYVRNGSYNILLLAGDADYYLNYSPLLLASSYVQNIEISLDEPNIINLPLAIIDIQVSSPNNVIGGDDYSIDITIDTKNPLLNVNTFYGGTYLRLPGFTGSTGELDEQLDTPVDVTEFSKNGNVYTYTKEIISSTSYGSYEIGFYGYYTSELSTWLYANFLHPDLGGHYSKIINYVQGASLDFVITWPE